MNNSERYFRSLLLFSDERDENKLQQVRTSHKVESLTSVPKVFRLASTEGPPASISSLQPQLSVLADGDHFLQAIPSLIFTTLPYLLHY